VEDRQGDPSPATDLEDPRRRRQPHRPHQDRYLQLSLPGVLPFVVREGAVLGVVGGAFGSHRSLPLGVVFDGYELRTAFQIQRSRKAIESTAASNATLK